VSSLANVAATSVEQQWLNGTMLMIAANYNKFVVLVKWWATKPI